MWLKIIGNLIITSKPLQKFIVKGITSTLEIVAQKTKTKKDDVIIQDLKTLLYKMELLE